MSEYNITVEGGTSKRLLTAGKYCDRDIVVTAEGGGEGGGEMETCNVELRNVNAMERETLMDYIGLNNGIPQCITVSSPFPSAIQSVKNMPIVAYKTYGLTGPNCCGGGVENIYYVDAFETMSGYGIMLMRATGDGWIDLYNMESG